MTIQNMDELLTHKGHKLVVASYGHPLVENVTIECLDCNEVIYEEMRDI